MNERDQAMAFVSVVGLLFGMIVAAGADTLLNAHPVIIGGGVGAGTALGTAYLMYLGNL